MKFIRKFFSLTSFQARLDISQAFDFWSRYLWIFLFCLTQAFFLKAALWQRTIRLLGYEIDLPLFLISGMAATRLVGIGSRAFQEMLSHFKSTGLTPWLMMTPTSLWEHFVSCILWKGFLAATEFSAVVLFGRYLVGTPVRLFLEWPVLAALLLAAASYLGLGMICSALILFIRRGAFLFSILEQASIVFGGAYFPVYLFPEGVKEIVRFLPVTPALEIIRYELIGVGFQGQSSLFLFLGASAAVIVLIGFLFLQRALVWAKLNGALLEK